mmetsp:Transcript_4522/g.13319  ORF Transcript_4522/g.13319 Transcript_4522/m.13319 type:complete len:227 (+) Transcript_4522:812-1492(+)
MALPHCANRGRAATASPAARLVATCTWEILGCWWSASHWTLLRGRGCQGKGAQRWWAVVGIQRPRPMPVTVKRALLAAVHLGCWRTMEAAPLFALETAGDAWLVQPEQKDGHQRLHVAKLQALLCRRGTGARAKLRQHGCHSPCWCRRLPAEGIQGLRQCSAPNFRGQAAQTYLSQLRGNLMHAENAPGDLRCHICTSWLPEVTGTPSPRRAAHAGRACQNSASCV